MGHNRHFFNNRHGEQPSELASHQIPFRARLQTSGVSATIITGVAVAGGDDHIPRRQRKTWGWCGCRCGCRCVLIVKRGCGLHKWTRIHGQRYPTVGGVEGRDIPSVICRRNDNRGRVVENTVRIHLGAKNNGKRFGSAFHGDRRRECEFGVDVGEIGGDNGSVRWIPVQDDSRGNKDIIALEESDPRSIFRSECPVRLGSQLHRRDDQRACIDTK